MFNIPAAMQAYWEKEREPKASSDDIKRIEDAVGSKLPSAYIDFVTRFGFVVFNDVPGMRDSFSYTVDNTGAPGTYCGNIAFLHDPERLLRAYDILTEVEPDDREALPAFPRTFLPVANDAGQGQILLELDSQKGRVWYWTEKEWAWGLVNNTWLGFVAEDFCQFINKLQLYTEVEQSGLSTYPY